LEICGLLKLWKVRKKILKENKENANSSIAAISNLTKAFSAHIFYPFIFLCAFDLDFSRN
jgi:hypothetical protein